MTQATRNLSASAYDLMAISGAVSVHPLGGKIPAVIMGISKESWTPESTSPFVSSGLYTKD